MRNMLLGFGFFFICLGLMCLFSENNSHIKVILYGTTFLSLGILLCFIRYKIIIKLKNKELIENQQKKRNKEIAQNEIIESKLIKVEQLLSQLSEIQKIEIIDISDFKKTIIDNEKLIIDKGGDKQLFLFMKIDSFLQEFRERIVSDKSDLNDELHYIISIKSEIKKGSNYNTERLLYSLGSEIKPIMENQIQTMDYYRNIATAMIIFDLNDTKFRYFEIYEAFEKLGVFDSTWQKNVLNKLENIENRLSEISNQLTELNQNFISLIESSENVASELKEINSSIMTNNMLQAITTYQAWRINKNTKSLRN